MVASVDLDNVTERCNAIETRLAAVEKIQAVNLPKFRNVIARLAKAEKTMAANGIILVTLKSGFDKDAELRKANGEKIDEILNLMTHAKSAAGLLRRHGPKLATFAVGLAVARGWIAAENGASFLSIFGI